MNIGGCDQQSFTAIFHVLRNSLDGRIYLAVDLVQAHDLPQSSQPLSVFLELRHSEEAGRINPHTPIERVKRLAPFRVAIFSQQRASRSMSMIAASLSRTVNQGRRAL